MIRGTTPTFTLTLADDTVDLTQAVNVYATFKQGAVVITKTGADLEVSEHSVDVYLDQSETLKFAPGNLQIQLNWTYAQGRRACTNIVSIGIDKNLIGSVLQ